MSQTQKSWNWNSQYKPSADKVFLLFGALSLLNYQFRSMLAITKTISRTCTVRCSPSFRIVIACVHLPFSGDVSEKFLQSPTNNNMRKGRDGYVLFRQKCNSSTDPCFRSTHNIMCETNSAFFRVKELSSLSHQQMQNCGAVLAAFSWAHGCHNSEEKTWIQGLTVLFKYQIYGVQTYGCVITAKYSLLFWTWRVSPVSPAFTAWLYSRSLLFEVRRRAKELCKGSKMFGEYTFRNGACSKMNQHRIQWKIDAKNWHLFGYNLFYSVTLSISGNAWPASLWLAAVESVLIIFSWESRWLPTDTVAQWKKSVQYAQTLEKPYEEDNISSEKFVSE